LRITCTFKSSTAARSCYFGLFPWVASLSAKKHGTPYFSARNRTSKYSRSCSQSLAELLRLRKAGRTPDPSSGFTNDVFSLFVSSQSKEDGLTKLSVTGRLGKLNPTSRIRGVGQS